MESQRFFEAKPPIPKTTRPAPTRPLLLAIASIVLPGSGHFFLGERRLGLALLLLALLAPPAAVAVRAFVPEPYGNAAWLVGRLAVLAAAFAVWDAPARDVEARAHARDRRAGARLTAWLDAMSFGAAHARRGEGGPGPGIPLLGASCFLALALFAPLPVLLVAELSTLALAAWGPRVAEWSGSARRLLADLGGLDRSGPIAGRDGSRTPMPPWWLPTTGSTAFVWVVLSVFGWYTQSSWLDAGRIDTRSMVQMEPYYRNPAYGMSVEMHATGWTFRAAPTGTFVLAQHPGEAALVHLALRPRIPWWDDDTRAVEREIESLARQGFDVRVLETGESTLAGRPARRVRGSGLRDGVPRAFELRTMAIGHRRYVFRMEWDPDHSGFARAELHGLLGKLQIEGRGEAAPRLAR